MEHQPPYIIAVLPRYVEIRTLEPRLLVQSIELQRPRFITSAGSNVVYVASNHFVWRLVPISIASQIRQLLQDKQFELALQLAKMKDDSDADKRQQIHHIQNLFAFNLFCQKRFDDSMQVFSKLGTDQCSLSVASPAREHHCHIEEERVRAEKAHKYQATHKKAFIRKIFTEDLTEVETLPRDKVLNFLKEGFKELAIPYLEHIIHLWDETGPEFHNVLIQLYLEKVQSLMKVYLSSLPEGVPAVAAGKEAGELGEYRNKLLSFLEVSSSYEPEGLISDFPFDGLLEERALLLGRMGKHEQALFIYVHILKDTRMAEEYCHGHYDPSANGNKDVYLSLLRMYLSPPDVHFLGPIKMQLCEPQPNLQAALRVLQLHHSKLNTTKAINLLPANTQIREIQVFLESVLEEKAGRKRFDQVLKSLLQAEFLRVQEERIFHQQVKCVITDEKTCRVCKKKIGNSAFARYPNGVVVHYFCCKDRSVCPEE
ncbi:hypothetical protein cypCar_00004401 [Cyprinus carpio]|nr:hypothetical protein cypCar_00004401 [Cyprinus carpio]